MLSGVLQSIRDTEMAIAAAEGLRAASASSVDWSVTDFTLRSLHPVLRTAIETHLDHAPTN